MKALSKSLTTTLGLNAQVVSLYRGLFRNLALVGVTVVGLAMAVVVYFDERLVQTLSRNLIDQTATTAEQALETFFRPVEHSLGMLTQQLATVDVRADDRDQLLGRLAPFVASYERVDGLSLADMAGNAYVLFESAEAGRDDLLERFTSADPARAGRAAWRRWRDGRVVEQWERDTDYDPTQRPWYQAAARAEPSQVRWTAPYAFFTTKEPGITVAIRWPHGGPGEADHILAVDVALTDIARYTMSLRPTPNGQVVIFTEDERVIGLPAAERFADPRAFESALLNRVSDLDLPVLSAALAAWDAGGREDKVLAYRSQGQAWWGGFRAYRGGDGPLWVGVLVPEADFLAGIGRQRNLALAAIAGGGILLGAILALSYVRRIRQQLRQAVSQIEQRLGQYRLKYRIGGGGNGAVYRARHALLRRPTAIKIMRPEFARSASAKARFEHEVQITASLTHPNTVAIYDFGQTPEGTLYYAMEYLTGVTLEDLVRISGPLPAARVIHILEQVCGSLAEAHGRGLIHRDVKPANLMLCERGGVYDVVKVLDFGLVKEAGADDPGLTQMNVLVGTPQYMAPEIISAPGQASPRSDLYAVGGVAYYLLTGHTVFDGTSTVEICARHLHDPPVPPSRRIDRAVPADLEAIVLACLEKDPQRRPQDGKTLVTALRRCADAGRWTAMEATEWWQANRYSLPLDSEQRPHKPLSNTELLVDMDERLAQLQATEGQTAA